MQLQQGVRYVYIIRESYELRLFSVTDRFRKIEEPLVAEAARRSLLRACERDTCQLFLLVHHKTVHVRRNRAAQASAASALLQPGASKAVRHACAELLRSIRLVMFDRLQSTRNQPAICGAWALACVQL